MKAAAKSVELGAKTVIDLIALSPELMDSGIHAAVADIQDATGHSEDESKLILKNVLIESMRSVKDEVLTERLMEAVSRLEEGETQEEMRKAA